MKKLLAVLLALMFVVTTNAYAKGKSKPAPKAENFKEMFSKGTAYGQFKTAWFVKDFDNEARTDFDTFTVGGNLHFRTAAWQGISAGVGFYTVQDFGVNNDNDPVYPALFPSDGDGVSALGEYYINFKISKTDIKIGAQELITPWFKRYDIQRVIPRTHEAIYIKSKEIEDFEIILGHAFREKDNVSDEFVEMSDLVGGVPDDADEGVTWGELKYTGIKGLRLWGAYHQWHNIFENYFFDALYNHKINNDVKLFGNFRYACQDAVGDELALWDVDSYMVGGKLGIEFFGATLAGLYSTNGDNNLAPWRAGMSLLNIMQVTPAFRAEEDSYRIDFEYKLSKIFKPLKGLKLGVSYGIFDTPDSGNNASEDKTEFDIDLKYQVPFKKGLHLRLRYANVDGDYTNSRVDQEDYRFFLVYSF
ncbi:MAG: OprD family porin [Desulfobacula sp.]|uniref:OprD family outer membrane porin n=1 Tax=Desulfobacula sp. TaxID=2593537 RepID=UPI0025BE48B8|nr:OprD family outer membrane porin [Desulfobacula sp.]MCD4719580.1 OprD family porin [Desulfobacula sp.]